MFHCSHYRHSKNPDRRFQSTYNGTIWLDAHTHAWWGTHWAMVRTTRTATVEREQHSLVCVVASMFLSTFQYVPPSLLLLWLVNSQRTESSTVDGVSAITPQVLCVSVVARALDKWIDGWMNLWNSCIDKIAIIQPASHSAHAVRSWRLFPAIIAIERGLWPRRHRVHTTHHVYVFESYNLCTSCGPTHFGHDMLMMTGRTIWYFVKLND